MTSALPPDSAPDPRPVTGSAVPEGVEVTPEQLRRRLDPETLGFTSTEEVPPLSGTMGQPRALAALDFGLGAPGPGYNVFVAGASGSGRWATVRTTVRVLAAQRPPAPAWVYVHNFARPERPRAISLRPGQGRAFARDMDRFVESARARLRQAFEDDAYANRQRDLLADIGRQREVELQGMQRFALTQGFAVQLTPGGIVSIPVRDGRPLSPKDLDSLSEAERADLQLRGDAVQQHLEAGLRRLHQLEHEAGERVERLNHEVANFAVAPLIDELHTKHEGQDAVLEYLEEVRADIPGNLDAFREEPRRQDAGPPGLMLDGPEPALARYRVNVFVDEAGASAPVVEESNPTYYNLVGRIDYQSTFGMLRTDFRQIRAGALQRANGGYLLLEAVDLLGNPFAWNALRRALRTGEARVENLAEQVTLIPTTTLEPEPIPLDVKVVLIGTPEVYRLLFGLDDEFRELFKVRADFAPDLAWTDESVHEYSGYVSRHVRNGGLRHFEAGGVARVIEFSSRLREHQAKLSTRLLEIANLIEEASFWAGKAGHRLVASTDVEQAIAARTYRSNLLEERLREVIGEGTIVIETGGSRVGQVNGLSVIEMGDHRFGIPSRITATVAVGRGTLTSVERQIELSGPIHSKGFLTLGGYLSQQYAQDRPLAVRATLAFEQSYEGVDGDSASSTELYALLSALSGLPLDQGIAVTGSVDQRGDIQAVGGVTDKIEGFFRICEARGLTGSQGVVIPAANLPHLMLDDEVVAAVRKGSFHVWAVRTADEGIARLTGRPAGIREPGGDYPEGSVHRLVNDRLRSYTEHLRALESTSATVSDT